MPTIIDFIAGKSFFPSTILSEAPILSTVKSNAVHPMPFRRAVWRAQSKSKQRRKFHYENSSGTVPRNERLEDERSICKLLLLLSFFGVGGRVSAAIRSRKREIRTREAVIYALQPEQCTCNCPPSDGDCEDCEECPRQLGEPCTAQKPCDPQKSLSRQVFPASFTTKPMNMARHLL
ncbi:unnamed protein product [Acanthoscelides obtectus]|uniref:Uncharacterized protein n=1 Tax=Acanthoscelides obtectus TaxID=200917 RepID=A0A9P0L420_ACAOB|nr:unnamed protein product [Acanthoscelides obtectus]CAK1652927.1 hypothetical protein AOBTE_LOCUS17972 [Acanthoscelides obtectus]